VARREDGLLPLDALRSSQVWRIAVDGGEAEQVTRLPLDVDALEVSPSGQYLLFAMPVFPGLSPEETKAKLDEKEKSKASGVLYERLFFREWTPGSTAPQPPVRLRHEDGKATDLMKAMDADCPSKPFAAARNSRSRRTARRSFCGQGRRPAGSVVHNGDLFVVPIDGSQPPKKLTSNPRWTTSRASRPTARRSPTSR